METGAMHIAGLTGLLSYKCLCLEPSAAASQYNGIGGRVVISNQMEREFMYLVSLGGFAARV